MNLDAIYTAFLSCNSISTDTRNIQPNCMFVALKGERFNANTFTQEALEKGASFVIIDDPNYFVDQRTILVADSLETLQKLAHLHRKKLGLPVIALTGSNGKTTTKELIAAVLSKKFKTIATKGNLNNHIGVPLTLLSFSKETEIGIVEMGANHQKEIEFLCSLAEPDYGYITNFGKAHLEGFGGFEGVILGKSELYTHLFTHDKMIFINIDDPIQVEKASNHQYYSFSLQQKKGDVQFSEVLANPFVTVNYNNEVIQSHLIGLYNATNICAAITIGNYFKVPDSAIKLAIENYTPTNNRSQILQKNGHEILLDAYNANPSSLKLALVNFMQLEKSPKIAVLGDMFELGESSNEEHRAIVDLVEEDNDLTCYFIGKWFYSIRKQQSNLYFYPDFETFQKTFTLSKPSLLLIKGSRGMALERTLDLI